MCDVNLTLSFNPMSDMNTTEFIRRSPDYNFEEADKVLRMSGRYSPFVFQNNYRNGENYIRNMSNCIILDFDDGFTMEEFKQSADFAYAIGTTKSHMIEKNGIVCERFRVIIPTETAISLTNEEHSDLMCEMFILYPNSDKSCKDAARAYSGYPNAEVEIVQGELFNWEETYDKAKKRKQLKIWQRQQREKPQVLGDGTKADWYRENWLSDKMRLKLGVDDKFISGNRNNAIYSFSRYMKDIELTDNEIVDAIDWINNGELGDHEIKQVLRGLRISE